MKKTLIFSLIFLMSVNVWSDTNNNVEKSVEEFALTDEKALVCAEYLLNNPISKNKKDREIVAAFMFKWMSDTPDHSFYLGSDSMMSLTGKKKEFLYIYLAALTKIAIESPAKLSESEMDKKAGDIFLDYCENPANKVKATKEIKQRLKERKTV